MTCNSNCLLQESTFLQRSFKKKPIETCSLSSLLCLPTSEALNFNKRWKCNVYAAKTNTIIFLTLQDSNNDVFLTRLLQIRNKRLKNQILLRKNNRLPIILSMKCYLSIQIKQKVTLRKGKARLEGTNPCDTPVHLLINKFEIN